MFRRIGVVVFALVAFAAVPALATSYVMVADEDLTDGSAVIAFVRVLDREVVEVGGRYFTDFIVEQREVLKGVPNKSTMRLRRPGGMMADGRGLMVFGMPELARGEDALVFLEAEANGAYEFKHYLLGAFHVRTFEGQRVAFRYVPESNLMLEIPARAKRASSLRQAHKPRDLAGFMSWVRARGQGADELGDYYLDEDVIEREPIEKFTVFEFEGDNFHRHEFAKGENDSVEYVFNKSIKKASKKGLTAFNDTLKAMSKIFNIDVTSGGKDAKAKAGLAGSDGKNAILTGDKNNEIANSFSCSTGGVLAIGGFRGENAFGPPHAATASGKKRSYWDVVESDVVIQNGIECIADFLRQSGASNASLWDDFLAELFGHEIYHSFGVNHSCGDTASGSCSKKKLDQAIMRASIHGDGRGAKFNNDDKAAAKALDYKG